MEKTDFPFSCPDCGSRDIDLQISEERLRCRQCGCVFSRVKLFFSYKHGSYLDQISQLREHLSQNGFYVWIDLRIEPLTDSWRDKIREAIEKSNFVLSFVSSAYLDSDVCKNEMNIAACCKKNAIRVLLMEGAKEVKGSIPDFVSEPQWFDISAWVKNDLEKPEEQQKSGETSQFEQIVRLITGKLTDPENSRNTRQIEILKEKLNPYLPLRRLDDSTNTTFFGRAWLFDECEDWRLNQKARALLLYAPPGFGKSTFVDYYSRNNPYFPSVFFCKWNNKAQCTASVMIRTIAYQLAENFPEYRGSLADVWMDGDSKQRERSVIEAALLRTEDIPDLFRLLITEPFIRSGIADRSQRHVILIDALNEMDSEELSLFAQALEQELPRLPGWLCFMFTSQSTDDVVQLFSFLPCKMVSTSREENRRDIRTYTENTLSGDILEASERQNLIDLICEKSEGVFLYASLVVQAINDGTLSVSGDTYNSLPGGLNFAIRTYISRIVPRREEFALKYRELLSMVCASPEPLPLKHIASALSLPVSSTEERIALFAPFLSRQETDGEVTVALAYQYYYLWFSNRALSHTYYCSKQDGSKLLADMFMSYYENREYNNMSRYLLCNFLTILEQCGDEKRNDLVRVIDDADFLHFAVKKLLDLGLIPKSNDVCFRIIETAKHVRGRQMYIVLATVRKRLALNYINQGKLETARSELLACEEQYFPHIRDHYSLKASILSNAAWTAREENLLSLADTYLEKAQAMAEQMGSEKEAEDVRGDISYVEGGILYKKYNRAEDQGKPALFAACREALEKAVRIWRSMGDSDDDDIMLQITFSDMTKGWLYLKNGEYRQALSVFRETLDIRERIFRTAPDNQYIAKSLSNIAQACFEIAVAEKDSAFLQEALQSCDRAISIYRKISGTEITDYNVAGVMITKGDILAQQNETARAVQIYQKAKEILAGYGESMQRKMAEIEEKLIVLKEAT